jgi:hypothetical protein
MTYAPDSLKKLAALWISNGGVNLGIVGDTRHVTKGTSYHLGKSQLADGAYSAKLPRDVEGLTDAASAIDLGKLDGSLTGLQKFSTWLVNQCKANAPGTNDIREVIWSPDGKVVRRWDDVSRTIYNGGDGTGQGDNTHLYHTHISFYRDAEKRDHTTTFRPYFELGEPTGRGDYVVLLRTGFAPRAQPWLSRHRVPEQLVPLGGVFHCSRTYKSGGEAYGSTVWRGNDAADSWVPDRVLSPVKEET